MAKGIAAIAKSLTAKKGAIHIKKVKRNMKNQFRKTNNVNCAILFSSNKLSSKRKSTNEVSGFEASTLYEW